MGKIFFWIFAIFSAGIVNAKEPIVTAEKLLEYKIASGHIESVQVPKTVLVCYQQSTMQYLLKKYPEFQPSSAVPHFYTLDNGQVGILGDWGVGAPGLAIKMEELVVLGAKRFIAVGTAGGLMNEHQIADFVFCPSALAEDGVAHLYLPSNQQSIAADYAMLSEWKSFAKENALPEFQPAMAWSFSALFRETVEDVLRVRKLAEHLQCDYKVVNRIVNEKASVSPVIAIKLAAAFNTTATFWLNAQMAMDLWTLRSQKPKIRSLIRNGRRIKNT